MISLTEVKELLQIDYSTQDSYINKLIPKCEDMIINHCKNHFLHEDYNYFMSTNISFDGDNNKIEYTGIENNDLAAGDYIRVYGSLKNDATYLIDEVGTGYLSINSLRTLKDEDLGRSIIICLVSYPEDLKMSISQLIGYKLENYTPGLKSEQIDDYSYTLNDTVLINGIPQNVIGDLVNYKYAYWHDFFAVYSVSRWW